MKFSIVPSRPGDEPALRALWQDVFGDGKDFLDDFFRLIYRPGMAQTAWAEDGTLAAAAYALEFPNALYIYAVATAPAFRSRGLGAQVTLAAAGGTPGLSVPGRAVPAGLVRPAYGRCDRLLPPTGPGPGTQSSHFPGRVRPKPGASAAGCSPRRVSPVGVSVFLLPGRPVLLAGGGRHLCHGGSRVKESLPCPLEGEPFMMGLNGAPPMYWGLALDWKIRRAAFAAGGFPMDPVFLQEDVLLAFLLGFSHLGILFPIVVVFPGCLPVDQEGNGSMNQYDSRHNGKL